MPLESQSTTKKDGPQIGLEFEDEIFESLRTVFHEDKILNSVIFSGFKLKDSQKKVLGEFDFLIFLRDFNKIVHIEVKKSNDKSNRKKAGEQLQKGFDFFLETFPFPKKENWSYVKVAFFGEPKINACEKCEHFALAESFDPMSNCREALVRKIRNLTSFVMSEVKTGSLFFAT